MKKKQFVLGLLASGLALVTSCEIDDATSLLTGGQEEKYVIQDKNSGTLSVKEDYKDYVALFEFQDECPDGVESIEFTADGTYHISFDSDVDERDYNASRSSDFSVEVEGQKVVVPMRAVTRSDYPRLRSTGTYTRKDGKYVLMGDYNWEMSDDGTLVITENGSTRRYHATPVARPSISALTDRLCHTWLLQRVLLKLYNDNKLVMTYHLTDEEVREYCVDTFVFTTFGKFKRYAKGENNGNGDWEWKVESDQSLTYWFRYFSDSNPMPVIGTNDLTVYFSNNHLYLTEWCPMLDDNDMKDMKGNPLHFKALLLYQLDVKGN